MTFYWWSHWFWITLFCHILLLISIVHTYPSQEISVEYNQNNKPLKTVTKLYATTASLAWSTTSSPNNQKSANDKTVLQNVTPTNVSGDSTVLPQDSNKTDKLTEVLNKEVLEAYNENVEEDSEDSVELAAVEEEEHEYLHESDDNEFKRSVEHFNKTENSNERSNATAKSTSSAIKAGNVTNQQTHNEKVNVTVPAEKSELSNYTNFTENSNSSFRVNSSTPVSSTPESILKARTSSSLTAAAPGTPKIDATLEWFQQMAQIPADVTIDSKNPSEDVVDNIHSESITTEQKVPFTLENVNKEDELRRAENEHRSRKSKVLSAEYKHINRFINYSSDSKSLLTRSASTAPNEFDDSNISSEALAIQRTYFLDAGAISAICFTIFGVCCTVGTIGIVLYRRRYLNKPQALSEPDSSVYIDDSTLRDNSDEMYSLDNDSFLNSLEAMTIQNYWTDTVKHTKL